MHNIIPFGEALIATRDLDPLYVGLTKAKFEQPQLYRWLLSYWMFYHTGVSSWLSEFTAKDYWRVAQLAAENSDSAPPPSGGKWPRGAERRHFRGQKCVQAVQWLSEHYLEPEDAVSWLFKKPVGDYAIMERVRTWPMFGDWIAFKVVDMAERCARVNALVSIDLVIMYNEPYKALEVLSKQDGLPVTDHYHKLLDHFQQFKAPPLDDRPCGPAEVETILCKWKSSLTGHYWIGKDIREQGHGLVGWGETAKRLQASYPPEVERDYKHPGHIGQRQEHDSAQTAFTFPELR